MGDKERGTMGGGGEVGKGAKKEVDEKGGGAGGEGNQTWGENEASLRKGLEARKIIGRGARERNKGRIRGRRVSGRKGEGRICECNEAKTNKKKNT